MPLNATDINGHDISVSVLGRAPTTLDRCKHTLVISLAQDEALALIEEIARMSWDGRAHLVIEADMMTFPREVYDEDES